MFDHVQRALAGRYTIERVLGSGGMATVYLARDSKHGRQVAVKVVRPDLSGFLGGDRFVREIQIAAQLSHPHIIPVYDSGQANGVLYYTMPYVEGESLRARLNRERRLSLDEALRIAREVATALSYAHARGVIHRDIKPENILLSGGVAVVSDFGIARAISAAGGPNLTASGLPLGTLGYMSPEQAAGSRDLDGRTDIYSLGCVLYEMVVGRALERWLDDKSVTTGRITDASPEERRQLDSLPDPVETILVRALAQRPAERFATADELVAALAIRSDTPVPVPERDALEETRRRKIRPLVWIAGIFAVVVLVAGVFLLRPRPELNPDVIAVAPFDVLSSDLGTWSEGVVDMLSASLDGAGPLRTVSPSVAIKSWSGRADPPSAADFGESLQAGLVVYGRLVGAGEDSARALATLYDVANRRVISEFDVRDRSDRIDRLADSLAVRLMGDLSRNRPLGAWRLASLGSSSPAALKAFLQGEQHYRRFDLDSARVYYERAIELDSTFALAHSRRAATLGWDLYGDREFVASLLRAGELNQGLARRESLLLLSDSIWGALAYFSGDSSSWRRLQRLLPTLEYAVRQYPLDPQIWYELGEARYHFGPYLGVTDEQALAAFATAVGLDSAFVPAYKHLIELTLLVEGDSTARHVVEAYLARAGTNPLTDAERVTLGLLDPDRARSTDVAGSLEALPTNAMFQVWYDLKWWVDSAETATRVARVWAMADSVIGRQSLALALAYRGRLGAAYEVAGQDWPALVGTLTRLGALPRDSAAAIYDGWLRSGDGVRTYIGLRWWLQEHDSLSLQKAVASLDSLRVLDPRERSGVWDGLVRAGTAYLALVRGDTVTALHELEAIPNWPYSYWRYGPWLVRAQVLAAIGRDREAAALLRQMPYTRQWSPPAEAVIVALERGRVNERLGNTEEAVRSFSYVVDAWRYADAHLQPLVEEARTALGRLAGEPREGTR